MFLLLCTFLLFTFLLFAFLLFTFLLFTMATDDVVFGFQLEQSIIITEDTLYLGIIDLETDLCHGKLLMRTVKPDAKVNRKRGLSSTRGSVAKKKVFVCDYCDYKSNAKYMTDRHVAKVHEKSVEPEKCSICQFTSLYAFNIKRHMLRCRPNTETQASDSSSNLRRSKRSRVIELSESSSCLSI